MLRKALVFAWIAATAVSAILAGCSPSYEKGMARGKSEYRTCMPCHGPDGGGSVAVHAPSIAGLPAWYVTNELQKFQKGIRGAHPDDEEGARMRPMARTLYRPGDLEAVAAYVASMPVVHQAPTMAGGDTTAGRERFQGLCITCHGPDARGNEALSAPPISQQADWYLYIQLQKFKSGMRGTHPDDVTGAQMRAMSMTMEDTTAMRNVIAFVRSLSH